MIRKYSNSDKSRIIELFQKNTPEYFDSSEEKDLEHYLDHEVEDYFVYELDSNIIGAGGINYFTEQKLALISWDMVDPNWHGNEIGKKLTQYRISHINENQDIDTIIVRTTQLVYKFYEKFGFKLRKVEKDYWAKNFDLYQMKMPNRK